MGSGPNVRESNSYAEHFDVFLCHNSEDKPEIRRIADELLSRGLNPWLDEREIPPGKVWQAVLEAQIGTIKSAAIFVGQSGIGPWQNMEMRAFLNEFVERACPVIPVVLTSAVETPLLPILLKNLNWVDFRKTDQDPYKQLIWGITGKKPDTQHTGDTLIHAPQTPRAVIGDDLFSSKAKQLFEVRLSGNIDEFSTEQQATFMQSLTALLKLGEVKITRVVAGSIRLYLELDQGDADKLYNASKEGRLKELSISEARLYPAIAIPPDQEQRAQLEILRDRVQEYWIDGILKQSLHHEVLISLGKHAIGEAVEPPWKHAVALPEERRHLLLQDRNITTIFEATGLLLILGEPGSGKTTSLLELAATLLTRAKSDPKERVPVVLNLSSWVKSQPIEEWIAAELSSKYRVPKSIAKAWLTKDYLAPLLDGLDELHSTAQPGCVAAINAFIENNQPSGLVVCCRLAEYQWLPERLKLNGAVSLEPLTREDVNKFLEAGGSQLSELQQAMSSDPVLQDLAQTPLMLSIMSLACAGVDKEALTSDQTDSVEARREHIFHLYVERMFERKESRSSPFGKGQTIGWLSWLAQKMKEQSQSMFMVENLQPNWLSLTEQRLTYETAVALSVGLIFSLVFGLVGGWRAGLLTELTAGLGIFLGCRSTSPLKSGVISGLTGGIAGALVGKFVLGWEDSGSLLIGLGTGLPICLLGGMGIGTLNEIHLVETMRWRSKEFLEKTILVLIIGLFLGLLVFWFDGSPIHGKGIDELVDKWLGWFLIWLFGGLLLGLLGGLGNTVRVDKTIPNQGIKLSLRNGAAALVLSWLVIGLAILTIYMVLNELSIISINLWTILPLGLFLGLLVGLNRGGAAVVKHYALRWVLWLIEATPFRFIPFLDYCAKLILLKKVGGGYIFIHRTLLDYFAALPTRTQSTKDTSERATT